MNPLTLDTLVASRFSLYMLHENIQEDNIQTSGTAPQKVEQVLKVDHSSANCGNVPLVVERLLLKVKSSVLFQDVEQSQECSF